MRNLTITIDNETLKKARMRALDQGTSVNDLLRDFLEAYLGVRIEQKEAVKKIIAFFQIKRFTAGKPPMDTGSVA